MWPWQREGLVRALKKAEDKEQNLLCPFYEAVGGLHITWSLSLGPKLPLLGFYNPSCLRQTGAGERCLQWPISVCLSGFSSLRFLENKFLTIAFACTTNVWGDLIRKASPRLYGGVPRAGDYCHPAPHRLPATSILSLIFKLTQFSQLMYYIKY